MVGFILASGNGRLVFERNFYNSKSVVVDVREMMLKLITVRKQNDRKLKLILNK